MRFIIVLILLMLCSIANAHDVLIPHTHDKPPHDDFCAFYDCPPKNGDAGNDDAGNGDGPGIRETGGPQGETPDTPTVPPNTPTPTPGTPTSGTPQPSQPQSPPTPSEPVATHSVSPPRPVTIVEHTIILTEIMFRDWSSTGGGGKPQWFELYNSGGGIGTLNGWMLVFETKKGEVSVPLDDVSIKPQETLIVTHKRLANRPWLRNIENVHVQKGLRNLKGKWVLIDAAGNEVYRRVYRWNWGIGGHTAEGYRQSVAIVPTVAPPADFDNFYGARTDVSTVGYHKPVVPAAPSLQRIQFKMWAALKSERRNR